ncbi:MAG: CBS domain-containing protein [Xanthomonadaceae bacterium]|nr:CBS domain-containing protein [Xanthomonadaceae bacterium]
MKQMPQIQKYMTTQPHTIGKDISIDRALSMMREYRVRHLPVQEGGKLVGVLTDRDLKLAASLAGSDPLLVEDVMTPEPYTVSPNVPLNHVITEMAEHKYGCAIIQQENGKVVGIFTATDGMRVFGEFLTENYKERIQY